jgi:hypothetical protein
MIGTRIDGKIVHPLSELPGHLEPGVTVKGVTANGSVIACHVDDNGQLVCDIPCALVGWIL